MKKLSFAQNAFYNTAGVLIENLCIWATSLFAVRFFDSYDNAGIWQLAMSITNIFAIVSVFNINIFLITDVENEYSYSEYLGSAVFTSAASVIFCALYSFIFGYGAEIFLTVLSYMLYRAISGYSIVLYAVEQRTFRMDYVGISHAAHGAMGLILFSLVLKFTGKIYLAAASMIIAAIFILIFYDVKKASCCGAEKPIFNMKRSFSLLKKCFPAVISSAAFAAINTFPRQQLENMRGAEILGYYATVATPIVFIQVLANSAFEPLIRELSLYWQKKDIKSFSGIIKKMLIVLASFGILAFIGAYFFGEFFLVIIYGESIREYCYLMYAVILCVIFCVLCTAFANILILMRKINQQMIFSLAALIIGSVLSRIFISLFDMNGVSFAIIISYLIFNVCSGIYIAGQIGKIDSENKNV